MTLGTSMAARQGPVAMAAHQICIQVWLAVSLLVDALGASAQALTASYMSKGDYKTVKEIAHYVLKVGLLTGLALSAVLGLSFGSLATLFTKDAEVLAIVGTGVLVGAPPEVIARLEEACSSAAAMGHISTSCLGEDPALDQFMEAYCKMLTKYKQELSKPFKEAMFFLQRVECQFKAPSLSLDSGDHIYNFPSL